MIKQALRLVTDIKVYQQRTNSPNCLDYFVEKLEKELRCNKELIDLWNRNKQHFSKKELDKRVRSLRKDNLKINDALTFYHMHKHLLKLNRLRNTVNMLGGEYKEEGDRITVTLGEFVSEVTNLIRTDLPDFTLISSQDGKLILEKG